MVVDVARGAGRAVGRAGGERRQLVGGTGGELELVPRNEDAVVAGRRGGDLLTDDEGAARDEHPAVGGRVVDVAGHEGTGRPGDVRAQTVRENEGDGSPCVEAVGA